MTKKNKDYLTNIYWIILFVIFPLCYKQYYVGMGNLKSEVFLGTSIVFVILFAIIKITEVLHNKKISCQINNIDKTVIAYFLIILISFVFCLNKKFALWGSADWGMGLITQLIFVALYYIFSREVNLKKWMIDVLYISSFIVFLLGILNRLLIDPLNMYGPLTYNQKLQFLSTIGQSSWYSGFLCTICPIAIGEFSTGKNEKRNIWLRVYLFIAFMSLVTQNTDSAYIALTGIILTLIYVCAYKEYGFDRILEILLIMFTAFKVAGILQMVFSEYVMQLDKLSIWISKGLITWVIWAVILALYMYNRYKKIDILWVKYVFIVLISIVCISIVSVITIFITNSIGLTNITNSEFLYYSLEWGNLRGYTWLMTLYVFTKMPHEINKLIGVGPDCFQILFESIPNVREATLEFFGGEMLANAHNEYLTKLINIGVAGLVAYISMLIVAFKNMIKNSKDKPELLGIGLVIISFMLHNIFCYENVCNAPFFYIFLGIGVNLLNREKIGG